MAGWIPSAGVQRTASTGFRAPGDHAVARSAEYSAIVLADEPVDQLAAVLKNPIGPFFVGAHHAGEARTVGA